MKEEWQIDRETEWKSGHWIRVELGVGPYALKTLVSEGKVRTRLVDRKDPPRQVYALADVVRHYRRGPKGRKPAVIPAWQLAQMSEGKK